MSERPDDHEPGEADGPVAEPIPFPVRAFTDDLDDGFQVAGRHEDDFDDDFDDDGRPYLVEVPAGPNITVIDDLAALGGSAGRHRDDDVAPDDDSDEHDDVLPGGGTGLTDRPAGSERGEVLKRARASGGMGGAVLMGALLGLKDALEAPREQPAIMMEVAGTPHDIDTDGLEMDIDDDRRAVTPPLPVMNHLNNKPKRRFGRKR